jgi:hypothetical protein
MSEPRIRIDAEGQAVLTELASGIDQTLDGFWAFNERTRWTEVHGSQRALERAGIKRKLGPAVNWDDADIKYATTSAVVYLAACAQHLSGIRTLVRAFEVIFPVAPIARSVMETCGRITWLFDPGLELRDRAARIYLSRIDDLAQTKRLAMSLGHERETSRYGQNHHELRKIELIRRFYTSELTYGDNHDLKAIRGQQLPRLRESVEALSQASHEHWNAGALYDYLSAATHPTMRVVVEMIDPEAFKPAGGEDPPRELNFKLATLNYPRLLVRNVLLTFIQTWGLLASYHGIAAPEADDLQERIHVLTDET